MIRTLKLTIAYDGTGFAGWQRQQTGARGKGQGARALRTIQGELEHALSVVLRERVTVVGSGRTDAGVHAEGQVAHVRTQAGLPCDRIRRSTNALLPTAIAVLRCEDVGPGFHARYGARAKRYRYRIFTGPVVPPFMRPYVWHVPWPLNVRVMASEAAAVKGRHDFAAFARAGHGRASTTRRMTAVRLSRRRNEVWVELEGDGFLHTMVRSIAGTLVDMGRGRLQPGTLRRLLRRRDRRAMGQVAPACGLTLLGVTAWARPDYSVRQDSARYRGSASAAARPRPSSGKPRSASSK